jgi:hypothetical protein
MLEEGDYNKLQKNWIQDVTTPTATTATTNGSEDNSPITFKVDGIMQKAGVDMNVEYLCIMFGPISLVRFKIQNQDYSSPNKALATDTNSKASESGEDLSASSKQPTETPSEIEITSPESIKVPLPFKVAPVASQGPRKPHHLVSPMELHPNGFPQPPMMGPGYSPMDLAQHHQMMYPGTEFMYNPAHFNPGMYQKAMSLPNPYPPHMMPYNGAMPMHPNHANANFAHIYPKYPGYMGPHGPHHLNKSPFNSKFHQRHASALTKVCQQCQTSDSPEWRRGPLGFKT